MTLVVGACGGAGSTTTALGLGHAWASTGATLAVVDATVGGGDLVSRGADATVSEATVETMFGPESTVLARESFRELTSATSAGVRILGRHWRETIEPDFRQIVRYVRAQVDTALYDLGHRAFGRDSAQALRGEPWSAIVVAVPCRADAFNRMRVVLETIRTTAGQAALDRTIVVVSHQSAGAAVADIGQLRHHLIGKVFAVEEIPYDRHLATGLTISAGRFAADTAAAYEHLRAVSVRATDSHRVDAVWHR
ncbi:hypothetical protein [Rhodococcus sp. 27YEA15]|uniref:hypothetical protein n=1 Tax=Rhodococcus sp. 27YEA15 TaxID=3156259 RepID=UPI003C7B625C